MEPKQRSKKRKLPQTPSYPLFGIGTRSKPRTFQSSPSPVDTDLRSLIKDLRTRRIFSPKSVHAEQNEAIVDKGPFGTVAGKDTEDVTAVISSIVAEYSSDKSGYSHESEEDDENGQKDGPEKRDSDGEYGGLFKAVGNLSEESVLTTPPDSEVFRSGEAEGGDGKPPLGSVQSVDKCVGEDLGARNDKKNHSISDAKSVLRPCFSRKLFKTPGSVSYKRLLPYLMDISKDHSYTPKSSQSPKLDKGLGQLLPLSKLASDGHEVSMEISDSKCCPKGCDAGDSGDSGNSPTSILKSANESSNGNMGDIAMCERFPESSTAVGSEKSIDEQHGPKFELGFSSEDHKNDSNPNPDRSLILEDDARGQSEHGGTDCGFCSEAQDLEEVNPQLLFAKDGCDSGRDYRVSRHSDYAEKSETGQMKKLNDADPYKAQNPDSSEAENHRSVSVEKKPLDDGKVQNQTDGCNEQFVQTTPPDAEIFPKLYIEENGGGTVELVQKSIDHNIGKPLNRNETRGVTCASNRRNYSSSKTKMVLNPSTGLKLYKSPGSFSYRRLLPFLLDITKNNSCASENGHCSKLEKEQKQISLPPCVTSDCQEKPVDNSNGHRLDAGHHPCNSGTLPVTELTSYSDSSKDDEAKLKCAQDISKSIIPYDSQKELQLPVPHVISHGYGSLETSPKIVSSVHGNDSPLTSLCPPAPSESLSSEEGAISISPVPVNTEMDCPSSYIEYSVGAKRVESDGLFQNTPRLGAIVPPGVHGAGLRKGILKRNPRGCRGLCSCLNCASFRLHAERAFEFSRNQMQDAEEVAFDLIKELSYLRNILEKSTAGVNGHSTVHVDRVKEACKKASDAEELATRRLGEMNHELNIHCRITCSQPPKVRFANFVEEKIIPKEDLPSQ